MKIIGLDEVRYLLVDAGVRYYEDAQVNGKDDVSLCDNPTEMPKMPCVEKIKERPTDNINSNHLRWRPMIDIKEGIIVNWNKGTTAHAFYKICDDGVYSLLDADKKVLYEVESYVPDILSIDDNGYGDYVDMFIDEEGKINHWSCDEDDLRSILKNSFGWAEDSEDED